MGAIVVVNTHLTRRPFNDEDLDKLAAFASLLSVTIIYILIYLVYYILALFTIYFDILLHIAKFIFLRISFCSSATIS